MRNGDILACLWSDCAGTLLLCCNNVNLRDTSLRLCTTTGSLDRKCLETEKKKKKDTFAALCSPECVDGARGGGACLTRFMLRKVCVWVCVPREPAQPVFV